MYKSDERESDLAKPHHLRPTAGRNFRYEATSSSLLRNCSDTSNNDQIDRVEAFAPEISDAFSSPFFQRSTARTRKTAKVQLSDSQTATSTWQVDTTFFGINRLYQFSQSHKIPVQMLPAGHFMHDPPALMASALN